MKKIIIKSDKLSKHIRHEAYYEAVAFENQHLDKKFGVYHGVLAVISFKHSKDEYQIYVYHTKTAIISDIRKIK